MRQIYLVSSRVSSELIIYDGRKKTQKNRKPPYCSLEDFLGKAVRELGLNPRKPIVVHLEGFNGNADEVKANISEVFPNATYAR